ncbi:PPOX class F420-dependent oxidoreductase [Nonomuraea phyllanthi]|uniref:PPOX class F420-dependent oxidoreductase n=1 Tax=Nonomuraea phyllanthi TaxID=2219224 RepID=A0A5C4W9N7_9ACTN|nr:PPOX class F420-dependent oxidoreductase [Nonomuraea phyllanthi]KAB8192601.1 PPOX class F420-dependent oxidoreductase [Nonomuraea phyllanthi]QFY08078.1 PPOX class F420-dependent oxidoreductase [Nonomuraea phyllanthi]
MTFTPAELDYLNAQHLGRLATVSPAGDTQNNPVGFFVDAESGTITIGGHALGASKKFRNIQQGSTVAFVVDDMVSVDPWEVRGIEIRGTAEALTDVDPPVPFFSREIIRITPKKVISWGLSGPRETRTA